MLDYTEDFIDRVRSNMFEARAKARVKKERPTRVVKAYSGQVLLVEWKCPACKGKPGFKGCVECRGKGVLNGIEKAIYHDKLLSKY